MHQNFGTPIEVNKISSIFAFKIANTNRLLFKKKQHKNLILASFSDTYTLTSTDI